MRIRTIKPEFFKDDELAGESPFTRLFFIGLWCCADANGIVEHRPSKLAIEILPYDMMGNGRGSTGEVPRVDQIISRLALGAWLVLYTNKGKEFIEITNWHKHQRINGKEAQGGGRFPLSSDENSTIIRAFGDEKQQGSTGEVPVKHPESQEGNREQGTGNKERNREGNITIMPSVEGVVKKKKTRKFKVYSEDFEVIWKKACRINQSSDKKEAASETFEACLEMGFTLGQIISVCNQWAAMNRERGNDPSKYTPLSRFLKPDNVKDKLENPILTKKTIESESISSLVDKIYGSSESDEEEMQEAQRVANLILRGKKS